MGGISCFGKADVSKEEHIVQVNSRIKIYIDKSNNKYIQSLDKVIMFDDELSISEVDTPHEQPLQSLYSMSTKYHYHTINDMNDDSFNEYFNESFYKSLNLGKSFTEDEYDSDNSSLRKDIESSKVYLWEK